MYKSTDLLFKYDFRSTKNKFLEKNNFKKLQNKKMPLFVSF